jgi:hypothetical protein
MDFLLEADGARSHGLTSVSAPTGRRRLRHISLFSSEPAMVGSDGVLFFLCNSRLLTVREERQLSLFEPVREVVGVPSSPVI